MNNSTYRLIRLIACIVIVIFFLFIGTTTISNAIQNNKNSFLLNPTVSPKSVDEVMEDHIIPRLSIKRNSFSLHLQNPFVPQAAASEIVHDVSAQIAVDLDNGEVLYEKNFDKRLPIASLTKIMTSVVALDLANEEELFEVSDYAAHQIPTRIGVIPDEKMKLRELLAALLLTSANDSATVIQEGIDNKYNAPIFIRAMNEKARTIGLSNSSFANPQGFDDPENYSTVEDLAILSSYALEKYPLIKELVKLDYLFLPEDQNHKQFDLYNWNGLIGVYPGAMGIKIGNTGEAQKTTIVVAERNGKKILSAVLGAEDLYERDLAAAELLNIGFSKTLNMDPVVVTKDQLQEKYNSWKY